MGRLRLKNPLIAASGCFGFGTPYSGLAGFDLEQLGGMSIKGTTPEPREGNTPPRLVETPSGLVNSIGLQNPGVETVVTDLLPPLRELDLAILANVNGRTLDDYRLVARRFHETGMADALEVNISCPNVKQGGILFGQNPDSARGVISAVREQSDLPLIAKLSPNSERYIEVGQACLDAGADALSLVNTFRAMVLDIETRRPVLGNDTGGLSGPAIRPMAVLQVYELFQALGDKAPIIGMGGIVSGRDAVEFLIAGASAVQVGTAIFVNPLLLTEIPAAIGAYLEAQGAQSVAEIVGTVRTNQESPTQSAR
jgi:dihydroorotate dehydrogenase (NAD+) catalytic subunit